MHTAGFGVADKNSPNKGVALRFNRHIRDRPDKKMTDATTTAQIVEMYQTQVTVMTENAIKFNEQNNDDDFDL